MKEFISHNKLKDIANNYNIRRKRKCYTIINAYSSTNYPILNLKTEEERKSKVLTKSLEKALKRI